MSSLPGLTQVPEYQTYQLAQRVIKYYPKKTVLITYDTPRPVRIAGYETNIKISTSRGSDLSNLEDSVRRTKMTISDIIICNEFDLFCTFTFDPKKCIDRNNPIELKNKMSKWLKNQRDLHGHFDYLIVPEFHKDGKAIHFHALFKNYRGTLKEASTKNKNYKRRTYNIKSYRLGYSTAVQIDNNIEKVGSYVKKYITKDMPKFPGKKRYWCSTGLIRPITDVNPTIDPFTAAEFVQIYNNKGFTISEFRGNINPLTNLRSTGPQWQTIQDNYSMSKISTRLSTQLRLFKSNSPPKVSLVQSYTTD